MLNQLLPLMLLAGVILLPLVPAFLLFKLLPNTAVVNGPFQGFRIDLSGAFGAYFILVVLILSTKNSVWDIAVPPTYQVWTVNGTITDGNGISIAPLGPEDISLFPPTFTPGNGMFTLDIPVKSGQGGATDYPSLAISHPGYSEIDVPLDPNSPLPEGVQRNVNMANRTVAINLHLQPIATTYQPGAPLNAQPAAPAGAAQTHPAGAQ